LPARIKETLENTDQNRIRSISRAQKVAETGLEQLRKTRGKTGSSETVAQNAAHLASDAAELLAIWHRLDKSARRDLLAVARGLASGVGEHRRASEVSTH